MKTAIIFDLQKEKMMAIVRDLKNCLTNMSDQTLLANAEKLAQQERELLSEILHHLREIDRRRLYSALKYPSLFEYAKARLHYSDDQAYRRIDAMRLMREVPELEEKINSGTISLSHMNLAQGLFRKEKSVKKPFSREEKMAVLNKLENQPARAAQKIVIALSSTPQLLRFDRIRPIGNERIEVKFDTDEALEDKIDRLKGLLAHKHPQMTLSHLFHQLCDLGLQKWDPLLQSEKKCRFSRNDSRRSGDIALNHLRN